MPPGRQLKLFLVDGSPTGFRTCSVGNWTGRGIVCPRPDLFRLKDKTWGADRPGVYVLTGPSDTAPTGLHVYVGESENIAKRLIEHDGKMDFWDRAILFTGSDHDGALNKAHIRWLEAGLARDMRLAKQAALHNGTEPTASPLPPGDVADLETFLANVRMLLPVLMGIDVLSPVAPTAKPSVTSPPTPGETTLILKWDGALARMVVREGKYVVLAESTSRAKYVKSLGAYGIKRRQQLKANGVLVPVDDSLLRFSQDYAFSSPSTAAAVVSGTGLNGHEHWKVEATGQTFKEFMAASLLAS